MFGSRLVEAGGRIKAAAESFAAFPKDPYQCYQYIQEQRKRPDFKYLQTFFPLPHAEMRQHLARLGLYRSTYKTDQGMPGNFSVFRIDPAKREASEIVFFEGEEGLAIPEPYADLDPELITRVQEAFLTLDLGKTEALIRDLPRRESAKGRHPFFFIRAAIPAGSAALSVETAQAAHASAQEALDEVVERARFRAAAHGTELRANAIYLQPDVMVTVEKGRTRRAALDQLHAPDVGMFFNELDSIAGSRMLPEAQAVIREISDRFIENARTHLAPFNRVFIATRDEVLAQKSDVLELGDIATLRRGLEEDGKRVAVIPVSALHTPEYGDAVLLMNVDYGNPEASTAIYNARLKSDAPAFFPDPFLQEELRLHTGFSSITVDARFREKFLSLIGSAPEKQIGIENKASEIRDVLERYGITTDIVRCRIGNETIVVPVQASQAWLAVAARIKQYDSRVPIFIDAVPLTADNGLVYDEHNDPRMHVFRFGMTVDPE